MCLCVKLTRGQLYWLVLCVNLTQAGFKVMSDFKSHYSARVTKTSIVQAQNTHRHQGYGVENSIRMPH